MSQKLQLKSDLTLETAIQIARQLEMVKSQVTDQKKIQSKKTPVSSRWRKGKGKKRIHPKNKVKSSVANAVSLTQSQNSV